MAVSYENPLVFQRADPYIYRHIDNYYYFVASVPEYDRIEIRKSKTLAGLDFAKPVVVWRKHAAGEMSALIWAPELHYIRGKWYIYFAAAPDELVTGQTFNHRMFVLEHDGSDPCYGVWVEKGQIQTGWSSFSLDATVMEHAGKLYYIWAQEDQTVNQESHSNIYIAEMENPWTLRSRPVLLTQPEYSWEKRLFCVNEGPAVLEKGGRIFLTYSASGTDENYCIGMLVAKADSNLLKVESWEKSARPVFKTSYDNKIYGPGHSSFTVSEDGQQDLLVYHARSYTEIEGDPLYDPNRHTRLQPIVWREDGMPDFGIPQKDTRNQEGEI